MKTITKTTLATLTGVASLAAFEGGYDYADMLKNAGTFYKDSSNPYIQKAKFYGRVQYQFGTVFTDDESTNFTELRRTRLGLEVQFLEHFKWKGNADLDNGVINDVSFDGFRGWDDAGLYADLTGLFGLDGFDKLSLFAGKTKIKIGNDVHTSSTSIKTVERTRWTDGGLRPSNSTGILLKGEKSDVDFAFGIFSNTADDDFHFWKNDEASFLYGSVEFSLGNGDLIIDAVATFGEKDINRNNYTTENDYAWSVAYVTDIAGWETIFNIGGAEEFDGDSLLGVSVLTYKEVYENLELVGRLSFAEGDHFAIDSSSRYARDLDKFSSLAGVDDGDSAFNAYLGLNYYFIGNNAKALVGLDYDSVSGTAAPDDSAITLSAAYRMKF